MYKQNNVTLKFKQKKRNYYSLDFEPSNTDVIVGKGLNCFGHSGNEKLRQIVDSRLLDYAAASRKKEKSDVLTSIVDKFRRSGGAFVQKDPVTGLWYDANDSLARDKVSRIFRRALRKKDGKEENNQDKIGIYPCKIDAEKSNALHFSEDLNCIKSTNSFKKDFLDNFESNNCFQNVSLDRSTSNSLYSFIEKYASSFPASTFLDNNPLEPNPIREAQRIEKHNFEFQIMYA